MNEKITILFENDKIRVEQIDSYGVSSDFWYNNPIDEWVSITKGNAILELVDSEITLNSGQNCYIKAHTKHKVKQTSPDCKWLCVYIK